MASDTQSSDYFAPLLLRANLPNPPAATVYLLIMGYLSMTKLLSNAMLRYAVPKGIVIAYTRTAENVYTPQKLGVLTVVGEEAHLLMV